MTFSILKLYWQCLRVAIGPTMQPPRAHTLEGRSTDLGGGVTVLYSCWWGEEVVVWDIRASSMGLALVAGCDRLWAILSRNTIATQFYDCYCYCYRHKRNFVT